ncbi:hypothetical protein MP638_000917 [Amoeboaphelidium occidentale]|nr:hypothetical protein MP638_000917 [Amoeboaphelidium occidentale]
MSFFAPTPSVASLSVSPAFGWNILVACGISLHVLVVGFGIGSLRKKYGVKYPDMGTGRFSAKLSDEQWTEFNNYQRAHYNYVEGVTSVVTLQLLGGLFYPKTQAILGALYILGRIAYTYGYRTKGPNGRYAGTLILDLALLGQLGVAVYGGLQLLGYLKN